MTLYKKDIAGNAKLIRTCSIWRALDVVGDVPTLLVLQALWLQESRFGAIQQRTRLPKALLSDRLRMLIGAGLIEKRDEAQGGAGQGYRFTKKGRDLYWVTLMLHRWETRWASAPAGFTIRLTHATCGHAASPAPVCGHCRTEFSARDVDWEEGPGLGLMLSHYARRRQKRELAAAADNRMLFTDAAQLLGDRWASLILRSVLTGLHRYDQILDDTAMATNILTERLNWLIAFGVLKAVPYGQSENRLEYRLTRKGIDYFPVLVMLQRWGDMYYGAPEGPPVIFHHRSCGHELEPIVACAHCVEPLWLRDTHVDLSPAKRRKEIRL
jgi:DNA-binding HxlR family transcriptional regulator